MHAELFHFLRYNVTANYAGSVEWTNLFAEAMLDNNYIYDEADALYRCAICSYVAFHACRRPIFLLRGLLPKMPNHIAIIHAVRIMAIY
jgi:hypothetical protein